MNSKTYEILDKATSYINEKFANCPVDVMDVLQKEYEYQMTIRGSGRYNVMCAL